MNSKEAEFNNVFSQEGGLFIPLSNNVILQTQDIKKIAALYINYLKPRYPRMPEIHFNFVNSIMLNAYATKYNDNYYIGINIGTYYLILDMFLKIFSCNDTFTDIGDLSLETDEKKLLNAAKAGIGVTYRPDQIVSPKNSIRELYAFKYTDLVMRYLIFHELGHIIRGHVDCTSNKQRNYKLNELPTHEVKKEIYPTSFFQTAEMDADSFAMNHLMIIASAGIKDNNNCIDTDEKIFYKDWNSFSFHIGFVIFSFFRLCVIEDVDIEKAKLDKHPPASIRFSLAAANITDILHSINFDSDTIKILSTQISSGAHYADKCFSKITFADEIFNTALNNHIKASEYMAEIRNNWNSVRPLLEPFAFGNLPPLVNLNSE